jgi:hypothetical protein
MRPTLAELAVVLVTVGAAAVRQVAAAIDRVHVGPLDGGHYRLQSRQVGVDVGDDRDPFHAALAAYPLTAVTSIDICI